MDADSGHGKLTASTPASRHPARSHLVSFADLVLHVKMKIGGQGTEQRHELLELLKPADGGRHIRYMCDIVFGIDLIRYG
jgi:hypothetical protein